MIDILAAQLGAHVLHQGDVGDLVKLAQHILAGLGYPLKGTGYFGGATDTAVTDFQKRQALAVDGSIGVDTARALDAALAAHNAGKPPLPVESGRPLWLQAALAWIGTREQPGASDNRVILNWAKDIGGDIAGAYTHDAIPWCALFANEVLGQVGLKGTGTLWALDFAKWGQKLDGPAVGAFAPMKRSGGGHIPIVVGRDQHGNLMCVGGNQSDAVNIKPFDPARVVAWRWPMGVALPIKVGMGALPVVRSDGKLSSNEG